MGSIDTSGIFLYHYSDSYVSQFLEQKREMKFLQDYLQVELFPVDPHFLCMFKLWLVQGWKGAILTWGSQGESALTVVCSLPHGRSRAILVCS